MGGLPKSLERTICLALTQWMGNYDHLACDNPPVMLAFPITSHRLRPALAASPDIFHTRTHLPKPDVLCMYEYLRSESKDSEPLNLFHFRNFEG